ncbi:MAG: EAL domain-containing protein, partial [Alphaproteobacteria bacterium]|nr:EAL domain-containing protein [Alphaproteobacteria bacterium]
MAEQAPTRRPAGGEEAMLVERLRKLADDPRDYFAAHVHLSRLRSSNRQPRFLDIAKRAFDHLVINTDSKLFMLASADMVLICRNVPVEQTDEPIEKVRGLFREDPLTQTADGGMEDRFVSWYDLSNRDDYDRFYAMSEQMLASAAAAVRKAAAEQTASAAKGAPLSIANLVEIERKLKAMRVSDLIREQPALQIQVGGKAELLFRENFVAMTELRDRIAPGVNLFSSPWLFQYLTEVIDRKLLLLVAQRELAKQRVPISMNLNINTVMSRDFQEFHQAVGESTSKIIVEFQIIDIFVDMNAYAFARDSLQKRGYRVVVDGVSPLAIHFFDPSTLKADFVKIAWGPEFASDAPDSRVAEAREVIARTGRQAVILARVDTEQAIKWGLNLGVTRFQGHLIDRLAKAMADK